MVRVPADAAHYGVQEKLSENLPEQMRQVAASWLRTVDLTKNYMLNCLWKWASNQSFVQSETAEIDFIFCKHWPSKQLLRKIWEEVSSWWGICFFLRGLTLSCFTADCCLWLAFYTLLKSLEPFRWVCLRLICDIGKVCVGINTFDAYAYWSFQTFCLRVESIYVSQAIFYFSQDQTPFGFSKPITTSFCVSAVV